MTDHRTEISESLRDYDSAYNAKDGAPDDARSYAKTRLSNNVTLEDWNGALAYLFGAVSDSKAVYKHLYEAVSYIATDLAASLDSKEAIEEFVEAMRVFAYYYSDSGTTYFPQINTIYHLLEFSGKGLPDSEAKTVFDPTSVTDLNGDSIFNDADPIELFKTGALTDVGTSKYAYDAYDVAEGVIHRYCIPLSFREIFAMFPAQYWTWSGTGNANGRLSMPIATMAERGLYCENGFDVRIDDPYADLSCKGISAVNFAIQGIKSIQGVGDKTTAIAALLSDDCADCRVIFKRTEPIDEVTDIRIAMAYVECDGTSQVGIDGFDGCVKASYLSFDEFLYSKEQVDAKFLTKDTFNEDDHIFKMGDLEANNGVYEALHSVGYPKFASATFVPPTDDEEYDNPLRGYALLINQRIGDAYPYEYGYMIFADNGIYWLTAGEDGDVITEKLSVGSGAGANSVQQKQDGTGGTFSFTEKNAHATAVDGSLTGDIAYGGTGDYAVSLGGKSQASGKRATAEGTTTVAKGNYSHSEGSNTVALGTSSHAEGIQTFTNGNGSHSEGNNTQALAAASHSEGYNTLANADNAHAEGYQTQATGASSHSEGSGTKAKSVASHAEGVNNYIGAKESSQPSDGGSVTPSQGGSTPSAGDASHIEGRDNYVYGHTSHAEGAQNVVSGDYSHAEGRRNTVNGDYSHVAGESNASGYDGQFVVGKFNSNESGDLFEVGNGTADNARSNAFAVKANGDVVISGNVTNGVNSVSVANIPSKATTVVYQGTFADGVFMMQKSLLTQGLYVFTYGNCSAFVLIMDTMWAYAHQSPIRTAMPVVYDASGNCRPGTLGLYRTDSNGDPSANGDRVVVALFDSQGTQVQDDYQMTIIRTGMI